MDQAIKITTGLLRKNYLLLSLVAAILVFFLLYNFYLTDTSLNNLRFTLEKTEDVRTFEDAKRLAYMLDHSLITEVTRTQIEASTFSRIELAKDILDKTRDMSQLEDARFVLQEVVTEKEKARSSFLVSIDRINKFFTPLSEMFAQVKWKRRVAHLEGRVKVSKDKSQLQQAYYELGGLYSKLSQFGKAGSAYEKAVNLNPDSDLARKARFNIAWNEKKQGNLEKSENDFKELVKTVPKGELAVLSQFQVADILNKTGNYAKAIGVYRDVTSQQPQTDLAKVAEFKTGYTYLYDLKDYAKAKETFDKLKASSSDKNLSNYIENKTIPAILAQYRREGFLPLIDGYKTASFTKYEEAMKIFDKILEMSPQDGQTLAGVALAYLWLGNPEKALELARKAVDSSPKDEICSANLSYIYSQLNMFDDSVMESKRLIKGASSSLIGYYNLGYNYVMINKLEDAIAAFKEAIRIEPRFVLAYNNLGWCYWRLKRPALAVESFEKAVKINPNFFDALFNLAVVYNNIGRYAEAKKLFTKVLELKPTSVVFRGRLE